jgi:holliday junction DNA helicase RuvA
MIRLITGSVAQVTPYGVVIDCNGIGYLVRTNKRTNLVSGDHTSLHTHLAVRENALDLYGFLSDIELECFELLLGIPKIGPKSAMQILDAADVSLIIEAVNLGDAAHLSKLSGITKKTAEKIVIELKDKIETLSFTSTSTQSQPDNSAYNDIFDTLLTLGYNPIAVRRVLEELDLSESTSVLVRHALQKLS